MTKMSNKNNNSIFINNLNIAKNAEKFTAKYLSDLTGINYDTVNRMLNGENEPKLETATTISFALERAYGYNPAWLLAGLGDMKKKIVSEEMNLALVNQIIEGVFYKYTAIHGDNVPITPEELEEFSEILTRRYNEYHERAKKRLQEKDSDEYKAG